MFFQALPKMEAAPTALPRLTTTPSGTGELLRLRSSVCPQQLKHPFEWQAHVADFGGQYKHGDKFYQYLGGLSGEYAKDRFTIRPCAVWMTLISAMEAH